MTEEINSSRSVYLDKKKKKKGYEFFPIPPSFNKEKKKVVRKSVFESEQ